MVKPISVLKEKHEHFFEHLVFDTVKECFSIICLQKKVQPDYIVDSKPVRSRQQHKPLMDEKARRKWEQDIQWKKQEAAWRQEEVRR